jgi:hypothetical protein
VFLKQQQAGIENMVINFKNLIARINVLINAMALFDIPSSESADMEMYQPT